ncbi:MAG: filamentous hemagglutinin N-terminal domain-containing protein [Cyanobacteria bacterium SBC]|nr:filamentous hemagglutinin N-terminal domain-containing protein [Cyanobacteria bacterium SBC]
MDDRLCDRVLSVMLRTSALLTLLNVTPVFGQIVPDSTLPNPSQVSIEGNTYTLNGGTEAGSNLFHSFEDFSVPTGSEAFFNNATSIENILTRVTGGNISNIDGLIRANGTANLFLINPNGIIFGPNARLDIDGSFFGTTANSIVFENGLEFSATAPEAQPLLTVSVPVGLQFNQNPGAIQVQGSGNHLSLLQRPPVGLFLPFNRGDSDSGLRVNPGRTLSLIGGDIVLDGGRLTAEGGRINLGSVRSAGVSLTPTSEGWTLDDRNASDYGNIRLLSQALVDASGNGGGSIWVQGRHLSLEEGSVILIQNEGVRPAGDIRVNLSESLQAIGTTSNALIRSQLLNSAARLGNGGDIIISSQTVDLQGGGSIKTTSFSEGAGGNIEISALDSVQVQGTSPINPTLASTIQTATDIGARGEQGDLTISTQRLTVLDGARVGAFPFGNGGGDVIVNASESIELIGVDPLIFQPSVLGTTTLGAGNAGNLTVNTPRLVIRDGGRLDTSTLASGNAGSVIVNVSEVIEVSGTVPGSVNPSPIGSSATLVDESLQQAFGFPPLPTGDTGSVTISTPVLRVSDGAQVTVRHDGPGNAGSLQVDADSIALDDRGGITASTQSGEGGNIELRVDNSLQLRHVSQISAEAGGSGSGGNLTISADTMALLEGSTINANAFEGSGGNIEIATQGLFLSPDSRITASSQLGVDGIVTVTEPEVDTSSALVSLSDDPIDPATQIVSTCAISEENTFIVTGNGGLPPDPTDTLRGQTVWIDLRDLSAPDPEERSKIDLEREAGRSNEGRSQRYTPSSDVTSDFVEANGWRIDANGNVELVSYQSRNVPFLPSVCLLER